MAGADQCEVAVNGIGERAGNTSLEEVAMAIRTRQDFFGLETGIQAREIGRTSRLVSRLSGMPVQPNKAIVGANAFAHEAGIHQDGVLKERTTYEIMNPQDIGQGETQLVMGKHSGRHAFQKKLAALGYELPEAEQQELFRRFKALTDKKKQVSDQDIQSLVEDEIYRFDDAYELVHYHVSSAGGAPSTATVGVATKSGAAAGRVTREAAVGQGPIEALYRALQRATGVEAELRDYAIQSVGGGSDAQGEVRCSIAHQGQVLVGSGVSTDILEASALAYLHALNKAAALQAQAAAQEPSGREAI
jgi:2-isopropylmalate synthase